MKKIALVLMGISGAYCSGIAFAGNMGPVNTLPVWTGFYVGANAGGWWSSNNNDGVGTPSFVNPVDLLGAGDIANALAAVSTNRFSTSSSGFAGGGQVGYNYQYANFVLGLEADINGLTNSTSSLSINKTVNLVNFPEFYSATGTLNRKMDYFGTVRGRLGYLATPMIFLYGTGGYAYGGASFNTAFSATESLGSAIYPPVIASSCGSKTLSGWSVGGGAEWMFRAHWTARIEYLYTDLGRMHGDVNLVQINNLAIPPVRWGAASVHSSSRFAANLVRVGVNYRFA